MTSTQASGTIITTYLRHASQLRVRFSCPLEGYDLDDLDALRIAIDRASAHLRRYNHKDPSSTSLVEMQNAFAAQQELLAAPS